MEKNGYNWNMDKIRKQDEIERNWTKLNKNEKKKKKLTIEIEIIGQKMKLQIRKKLGKNGRKWDNLKKL